MREIIRRSCVAALSLFLVSLFLSGLVVRGGFPSFIYAGILLAIFSVILDPVIKVVTLPFNILTLGLLSFLTTFVALFILTLFYHSVSVYPFAINSFSILGLRVGHIAVGGILSYVVISATIYILSKVLDWIFNK